MTTTLFTVFNRNDGRVIQTGYCTPGLEDQQAATEDEAVITQYVDEFTQYVDPDTIMVKARPSLSGFDKTTIAADGVDEAVMNLPEDPMDVVVKAPGAAPTTNSITGGSLEISADTPGDYVIEIDHFPYLPFSVTVTAT